MRRRFVLSLAAAAGALLLSGCGPGPSPSAAGVASPASATTAASVTPGGSGAVEAPAMSPGGASAPATPSPVESTTGGPAPTPSTRFALTTGAFHADGMIPARYTCDGKDASPALAWAGVPDGTKALALIVDDIDAHNFTHWIAYAIPPGTTSLAEGAGVSGSTRLAQGTNDFGRVGYGGPCPPSGTHRYVFTLYALAGELGIAGAPRAADVRAAIVKARVLGKATITGRYARGG